MAECGVYRNCDELKNRINTFKKEYKTYKPKSGGEPPDWKYYAHVDLILGTSHKSDPRLGDDSLEENAEEENIYFQTEYLIDDPDIDCYSTQLDFNEDGSESDVTSCDNPLLSCSSNEIVFEEGENIANSNKEKITEKHTEKCQPKKRKLNDKMILIELAEESNKMFRDMAEIEKKRYEEEQEERKMSSAVQSALLEYLKAKTEALQGPKQNI